MYKSYYFNMTYIEKKGDTYMKILGIRTYMNTMMCCCMQMYMYTAYFGVCNDPESQYLI